MIARARRMALSALVHTCCALIGLTGGYYAVMILGGSL